MIFIEDVEANNSFQIKVGISSVNKFSRIELPLPDRW